MLVSRTKNFAYLPIYVRGTTVLGICGHACRLLTFDSKLSVLEAKDQQSQLEARCSTELSFESNMK